MRATRDAVFSVEGQEINLHPQASPATGLEPGSLAWQARTLLLLFWVRASLEWQDSHTRVPVVYYGLSTRSSWLKRTRNLRLFSSEYTGAEIWTLWNTGDRPTFLWQPYPWWRSLHGYPWHRSVVATCVTACVTADKLGAHIEGYSSVIPESFMDFWWYIIYPSLQQGNICLCAWHFRFPSLRLVNSNKFRWFICCLGVSPKVLHTLLCESIYQSTICRNWYTLSSLFTNRSALIYRIIAYIGCTWTSRSKTMTRSDPANRGHLYK